MASSNVKLFITDKADRSHGLKMKGLLHVSNNTIQTRDYYHLSAPRSARLRASPELSSLYWPSLSMHSLRRFSSVSGPQMACYLQLIPLTLRALQNGQFHIATDSSARYNPYWQSLPFLSITLGCGNLIYVLSTGRLRVLDFSRLHSRETRLQKKAA